MTRAILPGITPPPLAALIREHDELMKRAMALTAVTETQGFEHADEVTQHLIVAQLTVMQSYVAILGLRIATYGANAPLAN